MKAAPGNQPMQISVALAACGKRGVGDFLEGFLNRSTGFALILINGHFEQTSLYMAAVFGALVITGSSARVRNLVENNEV